MSSLRSCADIALSYTHLDKALAATDPANGELLLVIDQLEEIFTHVSSPAVRTVFMQRLWTLAQQPTVQIIATLRVDFIGECGGIVLEDGAKGLRLDNVAYDEAHRVFIAQLGIEQIRATIEGPAHKVGLVLEAGPVSYTHLQGVRCQRPRNRSRSACV